MTNLEIIQKLYTNKNYKNLDFIETYFDDKLEFGWKSEIGFFNYTKKEILAIISQIFNRFKTYTVLNLKIKEEENTISASYNFFVTYRNKQNILKEKTEHIFAVYIFEKKKIVKVYHVNENN